MDALVGADPVFRLADATECAQDFAKLDDSILKVHSQPSVPCIFWKGLHSALRCVGVKGSGPALGLCSYNQGWLCLSPRNCYGITAYLKTA